MAEPCVATSSRSEGTPDGQLPAQADNSREQPVAAGVAEAAEASADAAVLPSTDRQEQQQAGEAQPMSESGIQEELRPSMRTRRQAAKRGLQTDFVRGDDSDSEAERSAGGRARSSNSWHPGDADSDSDASTRKRRKNEQASWRQLFCMHVSVQPLCLSGPAFALLPVAQADAIVVWYSCLSHTGASPDGVTRVCRRPRTRCCSRRTAGAWIRPSCSEMAAWLRASSAAVPRTATRASLPW